MLRIGDSNRPSWRGCGIISNSIGEVVPEAYRYLSSNPLAEELAAFDHVIVDEYQDLNTLEQRLLDLLAANSNLCIAGDDDQSIYSVRYANPEGILSYMQRSDVEGYHIDRPAVGPLKSYLPQRTHSLVKLLDEKSGFSSARTAPNRGPVRRSMEGS